MNVKVIHPFYDIVEKLDRNQGEVFEATKERVDEIQEKIPGYIEVVKEETQKKKEE